MGSQKSQTQLSEHASYHVNSSSSCFLHLQYTWSWPPWRGWSPQEVISLPASLPPFLVGYQRSVLSVTTSSAPSPSTLPENLGSWHSSLLGLQVILETMPLFVGRWHYIHASIVSQSFSLLEIFIISLLNNLYFVFSLVFSLPVPSTAIPFYFFFSYSILIKIILSILPKIWHKILWKKETPQLVPFFTNHHF